MPQHQEQQQEQPALAPQQQYHMQVHQQQQDLAAAPREGPEQRVSVMAFYVGQKLDLISVVQHNFLSHRGYKISDDILLVPLARGDNGGDPVRARAALIVGNEAGVVWARRHD